MVDNSNEAFELCSYLQRVEVAFDEADVSLDKRSLVLNPQLLRVNMLLHVSSLEVFDVLLNHLGLNLVGNVFLSQRKVLVGLLQERRELTILQLDLQSFVLYDLFFGIN